MAAAMAERKALPMVVVEEEPCQRGLGLMPEAARSAALEEPEGVVPRWAAILPMVVAVVVVTVKARTVNPEAALRRGAAVERVPQ